MAASHAAISVSEFVAACTMKACRRWRHGIGLCISGGPDSMALAALFSKIKNLNLELPSHNGSIGHPLGRIKAFIVDHQAREGSAEEAKIVARRLDCLGLDSEILQMQWPTGTNPTQIANFETKARKERYRLLARAAIRYNLKSLYLGHHQDDQVENFLMRLTQSEHGNHGAPSTALVGMRKEASIPCCNDIYGAFEQDSFFGYPNEDGVNMTYPGLRLVRPFLAFPKTRLQATCEDMGLQFFIDETNLDPMSTRRNAIRHLLNNRKLPRALQRTSLVKGQARIREKVISSVDSCRTALWRLLKIRSFDMRSGSLSVQFPARSHLGSEEGSFASIAYVLTDLLDAVSPKPRGTVTVSADIVERVIEILYQDTNEDQMSAKSFVKTVAGVLVEPAPLILRLSREPMRSIEQSKLTQTFLAAPQAESAEDQPWTTWLFWDNRYWLRIRLGPSEKADEYTVRAYTEADVVSVYARLRMVSSEAIQTFKKQVEVAAAGKTKFTLPVIIKGGIVIAFPTLNIILPDSSNHNWGESHLPGKPWQIRYKLQIEELREACIRDVIDPTNPQGFARSSDKRLHGTLWISNLDHAKLRRTG